MLKQSVGFSFFLLFLPPLVVTLEPCARKELVGLERSNARFFLEGFGRRRGQYRVRLQRLERENPRSLWNRAFLKGQMLLPEFCSVEQESASIFVRTEHWGKC